MNWVPLIAGMVLGAALLGGGIWYMNGGGTPTPSVVCADQLSDDYEPIGIERYDNGTVAIRCEAENGSIESITYEGNVTGIIKEGFA